MGDRYAQRWQMEAAWLLTQCLLGLADLWVGGSNGVQIQLYATWIFSAVLMDLCADVVVVWPTLRTHCRENGLALHVAF